MESYKERGKEGKYYEEEEKNEQVSTYGRETQDPKFKAAFEQEYEE